MKSSDLLLVVHLDQDGVQRLAQGHEYRSCDAAEDQVKALCLEYQLPYTGLFVSLAAYWMAIPQHSPAKAFAGHNGCDAVLKPERVLPDLYVACEYDFQHAVLELAAKPPVLRRFTKFYPLMGSPSAKVELLGQLARLSSDTNYVEARMFRPLVNADIARIQPSGHCPLLPDSHPLATNPVEQPRGENA